MGPSQIMITIAATRMHHSMVSFASGSSTVYDTLQFLSSFPLSAADVILGHMRAPERAILHPLRPSGQTAHRLHWNGLR